MLSQHQNEIEIARKKARDAEEALEVYLRSTAFDEQTFAELAGAVKTARDNLVSELSALRLQEKGYDPRKNSR